MKAEQSSRESDEKGSWEAELLRGAHLRFKAPKRNVKPFLKGGAKSPLPTAWVGEGAEASTATSPGQPCLPPPDALPSYLSSAPALRAATRHCLCRLISQWNVGSTGAVTVAFMSPLVPRV